MAKLRVQIVNGDPADLEALTGFLRQSGHEVAPSDEVELREGEGVGEVIVQLLEGMTGAVVIAAQVEKWIREHYARRRDKPSGVGLLGPDGNPLDDAR